MLSGKPPYAGNGALAVMMKHVSAPMPDLRSVWPECPAELAVAVEKMMQKQTAAWQQSYAEVNADLRDAYDVLTGGGVPNVVASTRQKPAERVEEQRLSGGGQGGRDAEATAENRRSLVKPLAIGALALLVGIGALAYFAPGKSGASMKSTPSSGDSVRQVPTPATGMSPLLAKATKDKPFVNTLGMEFVPVSGTQVLFCKWETRVKDCAAYARVNKVDTGWMTQVKDGVPAGREPDHSACGVSWEDAKAFCEWLTKKEIEEAKLPKGMRYRLPTDEEWSRAVGLEFESGATPKERSGKNSVDFPRGTGWPPPKAKAGNYADETFHTHFPAKGEQNKWIEGYTDGFTTTAPVGSFEPNVYGTYDLGGNVWDLYEPASKDRVWCGASWDSCVHLNLLLSYRTSTPPGIAANTYGFRCVVGGSR